MKRQEHNFGGPTASAHQRTAGVFAPLFDAHRLKPYDLR
jgi:hypothetical protein